MKLATATQPRVAQAALISPFYRIIHRIADRTGPAFAEAFVSQIRRLRDAVDAAELERAVQRRRRGEVLDALRLTGLETDPVFQRDVRNAIHRTLAATGDATMQATAFELGVIDQMPRLQQEGAGVEIEVEFDSQKPGAQLAAEQHAAELISRVSAETKAAVRAIVARSFIEGITVDQQARLIRDTVGLRSSHAAAVANLGRQLREVAKLGPGPERNRLEWLITRRRLDAITKQRLRSAIRSGNVTAALIAEATEMYSFSLLNRRAQDISRTEGIRAANAGQQQAWLQAADNGLLDRNTTRRVWIVTPDDRLRPGHAAIPRMNPNGVGLNEPFQTPGGSAMHPPPPHDPVNCRCGTGLMFLRDRPGPATMVPARGELAQSRNLDELANKVRTRLGAREAVRFRFDDADSVRMRARGFYNPSEDRIGISPATSDKLRGVLDGTADEDAWQSLGTLAHEVHHSNSAWLAQVRRGETQIRGLPLYWEEGTVELLARRSSTQLMFGDNPPSFVATARRAYAANVRSVEYLESKGMDLDKFLGMTWIQRQRAMREIAEAQVREVMEFAGFASEIIDDAVGQMTSFDVIQALLGSRVRLLEAELLKESKTAVSKLFEGAGIIIRE